MSLLSGVRTMGRPAAARPDPRNDPAVRAAGEHLLLGLVEISEKAKAKATAEAAGAAAARAERAEIAERMGKLETERAAERQASEAAAAAHRQALEAMQKSMAEQSTSVERLRAELLEKDAETAELRRAAQRAADDYAQALKDSKAAAIAAAEAAARNVEPRVIYQPAVKPEAIDFEILKDPNGLLRRVVLKAKGYEDVAVDIERGADNRMRNLKIGSKK